MERALQSVYDDGRWSLWRIDLGAVTHLYPIVWGRVYRAVARIRRRPWLEAALIVLASAIAFGVGQELTVSIFLKGNLSVCWGLVGLQTATLLRVPRKYWPWVLSGMVLSQIYVELFDTSESAAEIVADIVGDVAEVVIAAVALPALRGLSEWMKQPRLIRRFVWWPMLLGPAITAFPVAAAFSRHLHISFWGYWARWFLGDMLGMAIWLPLGVVLLSRETYALFTWKMLPRTLGLIGSLSLAGWAVFSLSSLPFAFVLMPILLLIALNLGFSGSVIAVNILSAITARGTLHHLGPFASIPEPYSVTTLQVFLAFCMLMCFPISIVLLERDDFERGIKDAYARMELLAISDGLTGINNRRRFDIAFDEEWRRAIRDGEPMGVMMIDVDCFKFYNDLYGHLAGDNCLRRIAEAINSMVRRAGDIVARFGGEEFVVLMPRCDLAGLVEAAELIRAQVESLRMEHERNPQRFVTISIGCASVIPTQNIRPETLLEAADQGLYSAKQGGRNRVATLNPAEARVLLSQAS